MDFISSFNLHTYSSNRQNFHFSINVRITLDFRCALAGRTNLQNCRPWSRGTGGTGGTYVLDLKK